MGGIGVARFDIVVRGAVEKGVDVGIAARRWNTSLRLLVPASC